MTMRNIGQSSIHGLSTLNLFIVILLVFLLYWYWADERFYTFSNIVVLWKIEASALVAFIYHLMPVGTDVKWQMNINTLNGVTNCIKVSYVALNVNSFLIYLN